MAARPKVTVNDSIPPNPHPVQPPPNLPPPKAMSPEIYGIAEGRTLSSLSAEVEVNGLITVPFKDGSKMTISIAPEVVRLSFVCHKAGVEKALVLNRTGNAVKTIADLL